MKFKKGDRIRIKEFKKRPEYWNNEGKIDHLMGKVVSITEVLCQGYKVYDEVHKRSWYIKEQDLEPVNETIVIYRKDREVIAVDKVTGDKAIAKCSTEDTFDFNVGAKLAFDRLMNGNKENITVNDMRNRLKSYCYCRLCRDCILDSPKCRCWLGVHFMSKDDDGNYEMSNEEIKDAYNIVFGTGIKESKQKEPHKFKVGDIVKGNSKSDERYLVTNSNMTRGKVVSVTDAFITIKVLSHKTMPDEVGEEYADLKSKYFDLVEEAPKLYNGKIVFTKGDSIFKTGHIYEIKDGHIKIDHCTYPLDKPFKDIDDVKDYFTGEAKGRNGYGWSCEDLELIEVHDD